MYGSNWSRQNGHIPYISSYIYIYIYILPFGHRGCAWELQRSAGRCAGGMQRVCRGCAGGVQGGMQGFIDFQWIFIDFQWILKRRAMSYKNFAFSPPSKKSKIHLKVLIQTLILEASAEDPRQKHPKSKFE